MVARVFYYLCMVAIQYIAPVLILLFLTFLLKTMGNFSWVGFLGESFAEHFAGYQKVAVRNSTVELKNNTAASILETAAEFSVTLGDLRSVFSPLWYKGLFTFLMWWVCAAWFTTTSLGVMYYSNNLDR